MAKKAVAAKPAIKAITKKQTKTQIITALRKTTGLAKKDVAGVMAALGDMIEGHMKKRGSGEFTIPDTGVKIRRVRKPARKARMGRNPATGEEMKIAGQAGIDRGARYRTQGAERYDRLICAADRSAKNAAICGVFCARFADNVQRRSVSSPSRWVNSSWRKKLIPSSTGSPVPIDGTIDARNVAQRDRTQLDLVEYGLPDRHRPVRGLRYTAVQARQTQTVRQRLR